MFEKPYYKISKKVKIDCNEKTLHYKSYFTFRGITLFTESGEKTEITNAKESFRLLQLMISFLSNQLVSGEKYYAGDIQLDLVFTDQCYLCFSFDTKNIKSIWFEKYEVREFSEVLKHIIKSSDFLK